MSFLAFVKGRFVAWTPRVGLDPTVPRSMKQVGAMLYAFAKEHGTEDEAQEAAEQGLYEILYGCSYNLSETKRSFASLNGPAETS